MSEASKKQNTKNTNPSTTVETNPKSSKSDPLETNTAQPDQPIRLDVLLLTTNMQNQNGIRLNDYGRYAKFCGTKINKLRKILKITQGKRKFNKIEITSEIVNDSRFLLILLLNCERKWATGMAIKQQLTSIGQDIKPLRYNIKKKFKKAAEVAKQLLDIAKEKCDTQTVLEAEAYYNYSMANHLLFLRKFQEALDIFKVAAKIYENFSAIKDSIEAIVYRERINAIKSSIRLCVYNINTQTKSGGNLIFDEEEFENNVNLGDMNVELSDKMEELKKENTTKESSDNMEIKYHGMQIPIKSEKVKSQFIKIDEVTQRIEKEPELNKKITMFSEITNNIDEIIKAVKRENMDETPNKSENYSKIQLKLLNYVQNIRYKKYIEKNLILIEDYSKELLNESILNELYEKDNTKLRIKPQEMIKFCDNLLDYQNQLINLEKENPDPSYIIDLNYRSKIYDIFKIYFVSLIYLSNKKYEETYTIQHHVMEKIKEALEFYEIHNLSNVSSLKNLNKKLESFEKISKFLIAKSFVKMSKEKLNSSLNNNINSAKNAEAENLAKKNKIKMNSWMFDLIQDNNAVMTKDTFESLKDNVNFTYDEYLEAYNKNNYNNYSHIVQFPPNTQLLNPKPIVYDLSFQKFQYPSLVEKSKKQESKGLIGRAFGYFFNK